MKKEVEEKLAGSLSAETAELLPFLPYLLQDIWELGSDPDTMAELAREYLSSSGSARILDLACGKGAVSVKIAQKLPVSIKGFDLIPDFIQFARQKAQEYNVDTLCEFIVGDINEVVKNETNYDLVILGGVGDVLGSPAETLEKLKKTVKTGGYILIDECYLSEDGTQEQLQYTGHEYLTEKQWETLFEEAGFELVKTVPASDLDIDSNSETAVITQRANELIAKYPEKSELFEDYIRSQESESYDLDNSIVAVVWVLKKL